MRRFSPPFLFSLAAALTLLVIMTGHEDAALGILSSPAVVILGALLLVFGWLAR